MVNGRACVWDVPVVEALLDELSRRGLMPGRPDTASMESALKNLASSWDRETAGGGSGAGGGNASRGRLASSHSQSRRGTQQSRGGASRGGY